MKKNTYLQIVLAFGLLVSCFSFTPKTNTSTSLFSKDSTEVQENDTVWNVVVYVEFGVDTNGHIHDVKAEDQFECMRCDSTMINDLKKEAVATVEAMPHWDNFQHKDIKYEIPVHMVRTHPHPQHKTHHHQDSIRVNNE